MVREKHWQSQWHPSRWQFSLSALLLIVTATAIVIGAWRILGTGVFVGAAAFVAVSAVPAVLLARSWKRAYLLAYAAIYGPFVVMATYTVLYVECTHCKAATWSMLPSGPGVITIDIARRLVDLRSSSNVLGYGISVAASAMMVAALTWCVRFFSRWVRVLSLIVVVVYCSFCAFVLLALIRA